jgi:biopolymer transport protein ExbB/TolQ
MDAIIEYLIAKGGIWGVLLAASLAWIVFRERAWSLTGKDKTKSVDINDSLKKLSSKHELTYSKIEDIGRAMDDFKDINRKQAKAAHALQEKLQEVNDERVDELKEVLQDYNKTMAELSLGIDKMNFILDMKLGD